MDALGLYISIPFCRAKCSFCNFASDAFALGLLPAYVTRLLHEIAFVRAAAARLGAEIPRDVDTIYFGGGTPSLLAPGDVRRIFNALREQFHLAHDAEITVECAPNQLGDDTLEELQRHGVNRLSFGIQSFVNAESTAGGRLHTAESCIAELRRVRSAGVLNLSLDLIAGLPHQTYTSWQHSLAQAIDSGAPHLSVYMLEIDNDSRLGREVLRGGPRYGAPALPSEDDCVAFYEIACDQLAAAGISHYEISNFSRPGFRSAHNLKYWTRKPYLGLGLDAHSLLRTASGEVRFANTDDLDSYMQQGREATPIQLLASSAPPPAEHLSRDQAFEETLFLGLRMNDGVPLAPLRQSFGDHVFQQVEPVLADLVAEGLLEQSSTMIRLTRRGRVLSNEVFGRLLIPTPA